MSGFSDRRTRDKSLWTFWSLLDCSLFSTSCASSNNFFGEPGMGERLWTNKCLTLDFPMVSPCIIPIKVSHKQAKNMLLSIFMEVRNSQLRTVWYERSRDKKWRHLFRDSAYLVYLAFSHQSCTRDSRMTCETRKQVKFLTVTKNWFPHVCKLLRVVACKCTCMSQVTLCLTNDLKKKGLFSLVDFD